MAWRKVCPECGTLNKQLISVCDCGCDLSDVQVQFLSDEGTECASMQQSTAFVTMPTPESATVNIKLCPICNAENSEWAGCCIDCGCDLYQVGTTRRESEPHSTDEKSCNPSPISKRQEQETPAENIQPRRICEKCGYGNRVAAALCAKCGGELSGSKISIPDAPNASTQSSNQIQPRNVWLLETCNHRAQLTVQEGQRILIGRTTGLAAGLPQGFVHVSREHAVVVCEGGKLYLSSLSPNPTLVNQQQIDRGEASRIELHEGDEICLGAYPNQTRDETLNGYLTIGKEH